MKSTFLIRGRSILGAGLIFFLSFSLVSLIVTLSSSPVSAVSVREVLSDSTIQEPLSIPPTTEGPGLILPDSPLFFLDQIKQGFRLFLAFTPEQKAEIHNAIAGERLAELQLMLAKNNIPGIRTALQGVSDSLRGASGDLASAKLSGRNIELLAKEINDSIKEKYNKLSILENKATGEIKAQVMAAKQALKISKMNVEDYLPEDLLINEIEDDLNREIEEHIGNAVNSTKGINRAIDVLAKLASEAAQKNQERRQEALTKAIEVKNEVIREQEEKLVEAENKAQEQLIEAKTKTLEKTKEVANRIDEAIKEFKGVKGETDATTNDLEE